MIAGEKFQDQDKSIADLAAILTQGAGKVADCKVRRAGRQGVSSNGTPKALGPQPPWEATPLETPSSLSTQSRSDLGVHTESSVLTSAHHEQSVQVCSAVFHKLCTPKMKLTRACCPRQSWRVALCSFRRRPRGMLSSKRRPVRAPTGER